MSRWAKPRMTVDEAVRAIYELWGCTEPKHMDEHTRAILHGVENDALERAALAVDDAFNGDYHDKPIVDISASSQPHRPCALARLPWCSAGPQRASCGRLWP
jgi:hypothetical protein